MRVSALCAFILRDRYMRHGCALSRLSMHIHMYRQTHSGKLPICPRSAKLRHCTALERRHQRLRSLSNPSAAQRCAQSVSRRSASVYSTVGLAVFARIFAQPNGDFDDRCDCGALIASDCETPTSGHTSQEHEPEKRDLGAVCFPRRHWDWRPEFASSLIVEARFLGRC